MNCGSVNVRLDASLALVTQPSAEMNDSALRAVDASVDRELDKANSALRAVDASVDREVDKEDSALRAVDFSVDKDVDRFNSALRALDASSVSADSINT